MPEFEYKVWGKIKAKTKHAAQEEILDRVSKLGLDISGAVFTEGVETKEVTK